MFSSHRWAARRVLGILCLVSTLNLVSALTVEYCSNFNTASTNMNSSIYQSNGLCHDFCLQNYAFAVVQAEGCWCSNYIPGTTTTGCNTECPGYKYELCGGSGLYGYIALTISPSGTKGAASSVSSSAVPVTVTASPKAVTIISTLTTAQSSLVPVSSSTSTSITETLTTSSLPKDTTTSSSSTSLISSTWTPTPVVSLKTVTGQVQTVTITPTNPPTSQSVNQVAKGSGGGGLSTGGAVGLTVGLVALVAVIGAMVFYYIRKRRLEKAEAYNNVSRRGSVSGFGAPQRIATTMSENSRYVLGTDGTRVVEGWEQDPDTPSSRRSRLMPVDPRLDPFAPVYQRGDSTRSRESFNTIRDDHDYSRRVHAPLRATNPDT